MARKKRRTSIRTAAGTAQTAFLQRIRDLRDDPLRVLPECPHGEPKAIVRIRQGLERVAAGKVGFLLRRDRGVVGAVYQTTELADLEKVPRLVDHKVAGRRRFFLVRGQVERGCMLGVQNHDEPLVLLQAYRALAKSAGLHFFAADQLTCTGARPVPPDAWWVALGKQVGIDWIDAGCRTCGHPDRDLLELTFPEGPGMAVCASCGDRASALHDAIRERYAGPSERKPVHVHVLRGGLEGQRIEVERDLVAKYRAGVSSERELITATMAAWREQAGGWTLGGTSYKDHKAFLAALDVDDALRPAIQAMTVHGHQGASKNPADIVAAHPDRLEEGVAAILPGARVFLASQRGEPIEVLRAAAEQARRRARVADLPQLAGLGPVGSWIDSFVRSVRRDGRSAGLAGIRKALAGKVPPGHAYAALQALGGDLSLEARFDGDAKRQGRAMAEHVETLLSAEGAAYKDALAAYLQASGSGESLG